jgi:hypothetical protein
LNDENGKPGRGSEPAMICCSAQFLVMNPSSSERAIRFEIRKITRIDDLFLYQNDFQRVSPRFESMTAMRSLAHLPARSMGLPAAAGRIGFRP